MRKLGRYLRGLPPRRRVLAITYLAAITASAVGIPLLAVGVTSHRHWMEVVGVVLLVFLLVENAIIAPIVRAWASSRKANPRL